jgi:hypothetical protein
VDVLVAVELDRELFVRDELHELAARGVRHVDVQAAVVGFFEGNLQVQGHLLHR